MFNFLKGKKTYIMALLIAVFSVLRAYGVVIPTWVWGLVAAGGFGAIRHAIKGIEPIKSR